MEASPARRRISLCQLENVFVLQMFLFYRIKATIRLALSKPVDTMSRERNHSFSTRIHPTDLARKHSIRMNPVLRSSSKLHFKYRVARACAPYFDHGVKRPVVLMQGNS